MSKTAHALVCSLLLCVSLGTPASAGEDASELPRRFQEWLEEVDLILTRQERAAFLALSDDHRRDAFVEAFWRARDSDPSTPYNDFRETYYARREVARERFGSVDADPSRILILNGEPAEVFHAECGLAVWPLEIWSYPRTERLLAMSLLFYRPAAGPTLRLWHPSEGVDVLQAFPTEAEVRREEQRLHPELSDRKSRDFFQFLQRYCLGRGEAARIIAAVRGLQRGNGEAVRAAETPPQPDPEWLATFASGSTELAATQADPLSEAHRRWLDEVALLITPAERRTFLALPREHQRAGFVEAFWKARDSNRATATNEFRALFTARRESALARWGDTTQDQARVYVLNGEPASVFSTECNGHLWPLEIWHYSHSDRSRREFQLLFYRPAPGVGPFRLWHATDGWPVLQRTPTPDQLNAGPSRPGLGESAGFLKRLREEWCPHDAEAIVTAVLRLEHGDLLLAELADQPPPVDPEWLATYRAYSTDLSPSALPLHAVLEVDFPARLQSRTVVRGTLLVPAPGPEGSGESAPRAFTLNGEVLRDGTLHESFRYLFQLPAGSAGPDGSLPLVFERALRPGDYRLVVKLEEARGGATRLERALTVPAVVAAAAGGSTALTGSELGGERAGDAGATALRLLAPVADLVTGVVRIVAEVDDPRVAELVFELDGKPLLTRRRAPWTVELRVGDLPRSSRVRAVARDRAGEVLAVDELLLNAAPHRFAVRVVEPREGAPAGPLRVRVEVRAPEGRPVERLELFLDDRQAATLYQPPWEAILPTPAGAPAAFVRAVAYLGDGTAAEDAVLLGGEEGQRGAVDVELVEVYASVVGEIGAEPLTAADFSVREDGRPQALQRFQHVTELPLHVGLLVDTSASMAASLPQVEQATLAFFAGVLAPGDRAAVVTFSEEPRLAAPFTDDMQRLTAALVGLQAERGTAVWDSLLFALHYFQGVPGRRALLLFSDGADRGSRFRFDQALAFAQHAGVAVYPVSFGSGASGLLEGRRRLARVAEATGGRAFVLGGVDELPATYAAIERELRSQYLLVYQSDGSGPGFRTVDVAVRRPGLAVRTMRGYLP